MPTVPAGSDAVEIVGAATALTVTVNALVDEALLAPVTWMVKVEVAGAVGVPLRTPAVVSVSPAGSVPVETTNCTESSHRWPPTSGCRPCPPSPPAATAVEIVGAATALIVTVNALVDEAPLAPVTWTVKVEVAAAVGVPLRTPAVDRVSPAGSVPAETDQL